MKVLNLDELLGAPAGTVFRCTNPNELRTSLGLHLDDAPKLGSDVWIKVSPTVNKAAKSMAITKAFPYPETYQIMEYIGMAYDAKTNSGMRKIEDVPNIALDEKEYFSSIIEVPTQSMAMKTFLVYNYVDGMLLLNSQMREGVDIYARNK